MVTACPEKAPGVGQTAFLPGQNLPPVFGALMLIGYERIETVCW